jgi:penicillin-binding protein 2B
LRAGYETGVIKGNDVLTDEAILLAGSNPKASWWNASGGTTMQLTAEQALEYSSNAYMMKLVFKMMGVNYYPNMIFPYEVGDDTVFKELRKAFAEYGMGTKTGIDIPGETTGIQRCHYLRQWKRTVLIVTRYRYHIVQKIGQEDYRLVAQMTNP